MIQIPTEPFFSRRSRATSDLPLAWRRHERGLHVALYVLASTSLAVGSLARLGPLASWRLDAWELVVLTLATFAAAILGLRLVEHSRALIAACGIAAAGIQVQSHGPELLAHTLASSQAWILGMACAAVLASLGYLASLIFRGGTSELVWRAAQRLTWGAFMAGAGGLLLRWWESYQIGSGYMGHVPISNLYEVFVLFVVIASGLQLGIQQAKEMRSLGALLSLGASSASAFLVWYAMAHQAHEIQPLVPALDSYWMKLHVPANFIGYGAFCLAALSSSAWLLAGRPALAARLPSRPLLEELSYRLIAVGFVSFTIATVLGALWAAEAWGGYWSWDPKETWALIVWLNYAAWLHQRMVQGRRDALNAWWSLIGLLITLFAFLGVNIYLSGLHSYGGL